jgi:hypothetical protein
MIEPPIDPDYVHEDFDDEAPEDERWEDDDDTERDRQD